MSQSQRPSRTNRPKRILNQAFAKAHNISFSDEQSRPRKSDFDSSDKSKKDLNSSIDSRQKIERAIIKARSTGKLQLSNMGLAAPLPDTIFDLRSGLQIDLSYENSSFNVNKWDCFSEEEISLLDLSDNDFSSEESSPDREIQLDERISVFLSLKTLRARRCQLESIPMNIIANLEFLNVLDLSGNKISHSFPLQLMPVSMRELNISNNCILSLSESNTNAILIELPNLICLDISHNSISTIPETIKLPSLQSFFFGNNPSLGSIPKNILLHSSSLSTLEGPQCKLLTTPDLSRCSNLRVVNLSDNQLREAPTIHPALMQLRLTNNSIFSIENLFSNIDVNPNFRSELSELHLRANKLELLPPQIVQSMTNLSLLDVGSNNLKDIPYVLGYLPKLRKINLHGNPQRVLRVSLAEDTERLKKSLRSKGPAPLGTDYINEDEIISASLESTVRSERSNDVAKKLVNDSIGSSHTLDLSKKQLRALPDEVFEELNTTLGTATIGSQIKTFKADHNLLKDIPSKWIDAVSMSIKTFDASFNQLHMLPSNICNTPIATMLLNRNRLTSSALTESLSLNPYHSFSTCQLCQKLIYLDLSSNLLETIPYGIFYLQSLGTLILSHNKLTSLSGKSAWKVGLFSLENLDLSSNSIKDLGQLPSILGGCCPKLSTLLLSNNELKSIPPELGLLENLHFIDLRGNPQRSIRPGIFDRSSDAVLAYLRGRMETDQLEKGKAEIVKIQNGRDSRSLIDRNRSTSNNVTTYIEDKHLERPSTMTKATNDDVLVSPLAEQLQIEKNELSRKLEDNQLSTAKKYALKKSLAIVNAKLIKEERRMKAESQQC